MCFMSSLVGCSLLHPFILSTPHLFSTFSPAGAIGHGFYATSGGRPTYGDHWSDDQCLTHLVIVETSTDPLFSDLLSRVSGVRVNRSPSLNGRGSLYSVSPKLYRLRIWSSTIGTDEKVLPPLTSGVQRTSHEYSISSISPMSVPLGITEHLLVYGEVDEPSMLNRVTRRTFSPSKRAAYLHGYFANSLEITGSSLQNLSCNKHLAANSALSNFILKRLAMQIKSGASAVSCCSPEKLTPRSSSNLEAFLLQSSPLLSDVFDGYSVLLVILIITTIHYYVVAIVYPSRPKTMEVSRRMIHEYSHHRPSCNKDEDQNTDGGVCGTLSNPNFLIKLLGLYGPLLLDGGSAVESKRNLGDMSLVYYSLDLVFAHVYYLAYNYCVNFASLPVVVPTVIESLVILGLFQRTFFLVRIIVFVQRFYSHLEKIQTALKRALVGLDIAVISQSTFGKCEIPYFEHLDSIEEFVDKLQQRSMFFEELSIYLSLKIVSRLDLYCFSLWFEDAIKLNGVFVID